jgi:hypothetical protein
VPDVQTDGSDFLGERLTVQFARGPRHRDAFTNPDRSIPRPRRTPYRMLITGLPGDTSWQVRYLPLLIWNPDLFLWEIYLEASIRSTEAPMFLPVDYVYRPSYVACP